MNSFSAQKNKILSRRTIYIILLNLAALLILIIRLYYLQVLQSDKYKMMSDENRISTRFLLPPRGVIFDRNGEIIAKNEQNFRALLMTERTTDIDATLEALKKIIPLSADEEKRIKKEAKNKRKLIPLKIKDNLSWEQVSKILLHTSDLPGVEINEGLSRYYPYGDLYAHVLGYVGSVGEKDKEDNPLHMVPGFKIGKSGLEKYYDYKLQGTSGTVKLEVNAYGKIMKEIERSAGTEGGSLTLTTDTRLQKASAEAFGEQSGAAVVLDVKTGEILAMVSVPSFDPNLFTNGISYKHWNELLNNERNPLADKAVSGQYSPGSTFKIVVALAALEAGVITADTRYFCGGALNVGSSRFHCWKHYGHGSLNVVEALKYSCDIFFYETALQVGIEKIREMALKLGLGTSLNVGLDNEKNGLIPSKAWKQEKYGTSWTQGDSANAGIGQGYVLATPLQMATMLARVVNGGYDIKPTFIKTKQNKKFKRLDISTRNIELVKQGMFEVVNSADGTARKAKFDINGALMGGKTGTTQVRRISMGERQKGIVSDSELPWKLRNHAWFIGYAPADNPRFAVAVIVEHGSSGSGVAAPIAGKILQEAIKLDIK